MYEYAGGLQFIPRCHKFYQYYIFLFLIGFAVCFGTSYLWKRHMDSCCKDKDVVQTHQFYICLILVVWVAWLSLRHIQKKRLAVIRLHRVLIKFQTVLENMLQKTNVSTDILQYSDTVRGHGGHQITITAQTLTLEYVLMFLCTVMLFYYGEVIEYQQRIQDTEFISTFVGSHKAQIDAFYYTSVFQPLKTTHVPPHTSKPRTDNVLILLDILKIRLRDISRIKIRSGNEAQSNDAPDGIIVDFAELDRLFNDLKSGIRDYQTKVHDITTSSIIVVPVNTIGLLLPHLMPPVLYTNSVFDYFLGAFVFLFVTSIVLFNVKMGNPIKNPTDITMGHIYELLQLMGTTAYNNYSQLYPPEFTYGQTHMHVETMPITDTYDDCFQI